MPSCVHFEMFPLTLSFLNSLPISWNTNKSNRSLGIIAITSSFCQKVFGEWQKLHLSGCFFSVRYQNLLSCSRCLYSSSAALLKHCSAGLRGRLCQAGVLCPLSCWNAAFCKRAPCVHPSEPFPSNCWNFGFAIRLLFGVATLCSCWYPHGGTAVFRVLICFLAVETSVVLH